MVRLEEAESRYDALRERDRVIASAHSKQRMLTTFEHLLDEGGRDRVQERLRSAIEAVRHDARKLALDLARTAFVELEIDDLARMSASLRRFSTWLDEAPSERLDACHDLLTFIREMRALESPASTGTHLETE